MKRVLFVDDEPQLLDGLRVGLYSRRKDWDMQFAPGGEKAIELMQQSHFDVLVTDLRMPGVDGTEVIRALAAVADRPPIIVMSGGGAHVTVQIGSGRTATDSTGAMLVAGPQ